MSDGFDWLPALLDRHAPYRPVADLPGLSAWQASDDLALWQALEARCGRRVPPPFFCIPWPGAQVLAGVLLRGDIDVRGRRVADVGTGSGLAAVAAMRAGAASVLALDVDPLALTAARELARRHAVTIDTRDVDALADPDVLADCDVVLGADLVYEAGQAPALRTAVATWRRHAIVVLADSGRPHFDPVGLTLILERELTVPPGVEGRSRRLVRVYST